MTKMFHMKQNTYTKNCIIQTILLIILRLFPSMIKFVVFNFLLRILSFIEELFNQYIIKPLNYPMYLNENKYYL